MVKVSNNGKENQQICFIGGVGCVLAPGMSLDVDEKTVYKEEMERIGKVLSIESIEVVFPKKKGYESVSVVEAQ